jgi:MoxR-like ATPase
MTLEPTLVYRPLIAPLHDAPPEPPAAAASAGTAALDAPDRRDGRIYRCEPPLQLAVELALATGRPLLLRGDPGSGKSSLAAYVARNLGYRYYEQVVSSQTSAQDLLWRFDIVHRLADAQARLQGTAVPLNDHDYIEPGVLWWVFDREQAQRRGWDPTSGLPKPASNAVEPEAAINAGRDADAAVVLIDELDKADPDVPNALLVPLGSMQFEVTDLRRSPVKVKLQGGKLERQGASGQPISRLLVVVTTNEERELPPAFLRRCIVHRLEHPKAERLVEIARLHFDRPGVRPFGERDRVRAEAVARRLDQLREVRARERRRLPGTAEYLDAVRACITLDIDVGSTTWEAVERASLLKDEGLRL